MKQFFTQDPLEVSEKSKQLEKPQTVRKLDRDSEEYQFFNELDSEIKKISVTESNVSALFEKYLQVLLKSGFQPCYFYNVLSKSQISEQFKIASLSSAKIYFSGLRLLFQRAVDSLNPTDVEKSLKLILLMKLESFPQNWNFADLLLEALLKFLSPPKGQHQQKQIYTLLNLRLAVQASEQLVSRVQGIDKIGFQVLALYEAVSNLASSLVLDLNNHPRLIENQNFLRLLSQLLSAALTLDKAARTVPDYQTPKIQKLAEQYILKYHKFLYLGLSLYHQKIFGKEQKDGNLPEQYFSSQGMKEVTSTSEQSQSENDENLQKNREGSKQDALFRKIRWQTCVLLREVLSGNRALIQQHWGHFLKFNNITKPFVREYSGFPEPNVLRAREKSASRTSFSYEQIKLIEANYLDPSLTGALLLESEERSKQELLALADLILENLDARNWMKGLEAEKVEKQNNNSQLRSYQIYLVLKNIHHTLMFYLQREESLSGVLSGLRLLASLITKTGVFQKIREEEGILVFAERLVLPLLAAVGEANRELAQLEGGGGGGRVRALGLLQLALEALSCLNQMLPAEVSAQHFLRAFCATPELLHGLSREQLDAEALRSRNLVLTVATVLSAQLGPAGNAQVEQLPQSLAVECLHFFTRLSSVARESFYDSGLALWKFLRERYERTSRAHSRIVLVFLRLFEQLNQSPAQASQRLTDEEEIDQPRPEQESELSAAFREEFEVRFLPAVLRDLLEERLRDESQESHKEFLLVFFGLLQNLREPNLGKKEYREETLDRISGFLFRFEPARQAPPVRQQFYQTISALCRLPYFVRDQVSALRLYGILERGVQESQSKAILQQRVLQGLANWVQTVPQFYGRADELLEICARALESKNEKLQSAGVRCLGLVFQKHRVSEQRLAHVRQVYVTHFQSRSVKVCWNTCVSLRMALKGPENGRIVDERVLEGLIGILEGRENFKTQIQSLQTLEALDPGLLRARLTQILHSTKSLIHDNDNPYSFVEFKYYDTLQELSVGLFVRTLSALSLQESAHEAFIRALVQDELSLLLDILQKYLYIQWRKTREDVILAFNEKEKLIQEQGFIQSEKIKEKIFNLKKKITDFEQDLELKNDENVVLNFGLQKLDGAQREVLIQDLGQVRSISRTVCQVIDGSEEIQVSFALYDQFQKYRDLSLESTEVISIPVIQN